MKMKNTVADYSKFNEDRIVELLNAFGLSYSANAKNPISNSFRKKDMEFVSKYDISLFGEYFDDIIIHIFNTGHSKPYEIFTPTDSKEGFYRMGNTFEEFSKDLRDAIEEAQDVL